MNRNSGDLTLARRVKQEVDADLAAPILAEQVLAGEIGAEKLDGRGRKLDHKSELFGGLVSELQINPIDDEARKMMIEQICYGSFGKRDLRDCEVWKVVKDWLMPAQREVLDKQLPERILLPSGLRAKVRYQNDGPPILSATIQKLYGLEKSPVIAFGKIGVAVEVLAPNQRPLTVDARYEIVLGKRLSAFEKRVKRSLSKTRMALIEIFSWKFYESLAR